MAERLQNYKTLSRIERVLKNGVLAEKGNIACIDTADGSLTVSAVSTTLIPIGEFEETLTGDGTIVAGVTLFAPIDVAVLINASVGPVADTDMLKTTYLHSAFEVSMTATGKSKAGTVWGVIGSGAGAKVLVQTVVAGAP